MPRPADAKIWNEDLVKALEARYEQARQQGKQRQFLWRDGKEAVQAVRTDIYAFTTGRIVGLPKLKKTVDELCRAIIAGKAPIYPPGYVPSFAEEHQNTNGNPYLNDPYLRKIKTGGGAVAILLAFHVSQNDVMTQSQICRIAQQFCDDPMEANFHTGRMYGAWSSSKTLQNHGLITAHSTVGYNANARGFRANGPCTYSLSRNGRKFVDALLESRSVLRDQVQRVVGPQQTNTSAAAAALSRPDQWQPEPVGIKDIQPQVVAAPRGSTAFDDESQLRVWVQTAELGDFKDFRVSKARRQRLHDVCDELTSVLHSCGMQLMHQSTGEARARTLRVTMVNVASAAVTQASTVPVSPMEFLSPSESLPSMPRIASLQVASVAKSPDRKRPEELFSGPGHQLNDSGTPTKRKRLVPAAVAAANAALTRQAYHESMAPIKALPRQTRVDVQRIAKVEPEAIDLASSDDDDRKMPAVELVAGAKGVLDRHRGSPNRFIDLIGSDSDDDIPPSSGVTMKSSNPGRKECTVPVKKLFVLIDSRERDKNKTPRAMRIDLIRQVQLYASGGSVMPQGGVPPTVEEQQLGVGDFVFDVADPTGANRARLPVIIERKRVSDLVQRSAHGDHWRQLQKMVALSDSTSVFLIEGSIAQAGRFTAFGSHGMEDLSRLNHTIENESDLVRFIGRAILFSPSKVRFYQTSNEIGSFRAVLAIGLVASTVQIPATANGEKFQPGDSKTKKRALRERLKLGGIPELIAVRLGDELGSLSVLQELYSNVEEEDIRDQLLAPLIEDLCDAVGSRISPKSWSMAVHRVFSSTLTDPASAVEVFENTKSLVEDEASLLGLLHSGSSADVAINMILDGGAVHQRQPRRILHVSISTGTTTVEKFGLDNVDDHCFYKVALDLDRSRKIPLIVMRSVEGDLASRPFHVFIVDGSRIVEIATCLFQASQGSLFDRVASTASQLRRECVTGLASDSVDIVVVRGLGPAFDVVAKGDFDVSKVRFVSDLILAELMLAQDTIVLQAARKSHDCDLIVQQLALSCYQFQLLTCRRQG